MKKKILTILLMIVMLFQLSYIGYSENDEKINETNAVYQSGKTLLVGLGIFDEGFEKDFENETLNRGQAAMLVTKLLDEEKNFYSYRGIFSDVSKEYEYALHIEKLADLGIVRGDGDFRFRPEDALTYDEAIGMIMNVLGFGLVRNSGIDAKLEAQKFGVLDNLAYEYSEVSFEDFVILMRNALMSGMFEQKTYGSNAEFGKTDQTLLNKVYDIVYADGAVVKNDVTSIWSSEELSDDTAWIRLNDNTVLELHTKNPAALRDEIGKKFRVYYKFDTDMSRNEYVFHEDKGFSRSLKIGLDQINSSRSSFATHKIEYYDDKDNVKEVGFSSQYKLIYNGAAYKNDSIDWTATADKVGYAELVDSYGNGSYDIIKIYVYDSMVVGNVSVAHNFITDKFDVNKTVDINKEHYSKIFVYDENNAETDITLIPIGSIISVAKSDTYNGNDTLIIRMSEKTVNGKVTKINKRGSQRYIQIDNEQKYDLFERAFSTDCSVGSNVIIYADVFGNAIYISADYLRDMQYGVVCGVSVSKRTIDPELKLRVTNMNGETILYDVDKNVSIDGESYKNRLAEAGAVLRGINISSTDISIPQGVYPVRFKLNADENAVSVIDTPNKNAGGERDSLEVLGKGMYYVNSGNVFGWTVPFMTDASVLEFTNSDYSVTDAYNSEISKINAGTASLIKSNQVYKVLLCKSDAESEYCDFIMKFNYADANISYDNGLFVVDEVCESYDSKKEENVYLVCGYLSGTYREIWCGKDDTLASTIKDLRRGDVIRFDTTDDRMLIRYEEVLRHSDTGITTKKIPGHALNPGASSSTTLINGFVYSTKDTLVKTNVFPFGSIPQTPDNINWSEEIANGSLKYTNITAAAPITVVNYEKDKISAGSFADILSYESFGNNCSRILARYRNGNLKEVIVYNTVSE